MSAAEGAPLCRDEGLWGTAWCLVARTASLGYDAGAYALTKCIPLQWLAFFESVRLPGQVAGAMCVTPTSLRQSCTVSLTPVLAEVQRRLPTKIWTSTISVCPPGFLLDLQAAAEKHRAAFVASFPKHAAILQTGDMPELIAVCAWIGFAFALLSYAYDARQMRRRRPEVMFFPDKSGKNVDRICCEIARARRRVWLAMFAFTDDLLSEALVRALDRGVDVRVIVDDEQCEMQGAEATWLAKRGVPVMTDASGARMHHKFVVLDGTVLSGSFNWTRAASISNNENLCVLRDLSVVKAFACEFCTLWSKFGDRGGRLHVRRARRRCHTPPIHQHTHGGG